jgi:cytochrome c oxidase cbb3-type subunit I
MSDAAVQSSQDAATRAEIDRSCRDPVMFFFASAVFWLLVGTTFAILASVKLHSPGFLSSWDWLTFGRVRPAHLNTMGYGWASMAGIGVLLWLQARLSRVTLPFQGALVAGCMLWNVAVAGGTVAILAGGGTSVEWLEFPYFWNLFLAAVFGIVMLASLTMFARRRASHVYVSQWYLFGAVLWFPFLFVVATWMIHGGVAAGVVKATANWWYAHNVLGLWLTPIGLAAAYYFIPKVLGRPVHSYYLSIFGFWTLALFYNWAGTHHLVGGPIPAWLVTVGIVGSMMMFIPVTTVAINHHMTMKGHFSRLKVSPTLRFVVFGAMSYTAVSFQGSLQALRKVNEVTHFTHFTIAHAHLGVYAFFTMMMFGAMYYIVPRLLGQEWSSARLIRVHFWCTAAGMTIYFVGLTWGGWFQGLMLNDPDVPFLDIVRYTLPFLWSRSFAGILMTVGHIAFAILCFKMFLLRARQGGGPTLLGKEGAA